MQTAATGTARPAPMPNVSYGPYRLMEAVPWLMLASAMRFLAYSSPALALPALAVANLALFLAFLIATCRMIEFSDGHTDLAHLSFQEQIKLGRNVLYRVFGLLVAVSTTAALVGASAVAPHLMLGFDGIAFDQFSKTGMVWSSVLACIVLLMAVGAGLNRTVSLRDAMIELWRRARWLLPAIVAVTACQFVLTYMQGAARGVLHDFWQTSAAPQLFKGFLYFGFVFTFASVRLWATLAILTFALRESYRGRDVRGPN